MSNTFRVKILHSKGYLSKYDCCIIFFNFLLIDYFIKEISSFGIFHDKIELFRSLYDLIQLDNKRMSEFFHDFKLS